MDWMRLIGGSPSEVPCDWREGRSRKPRQEYILQHAEECYSDVIFKIGPQREIIHAHKIHLIAQSAQFQRELKAPGPLTIELPQFQPKAFKQLLQYIYLGTLPEFGDAKESLSDALEFVKVIGLYVPEVVPGIQLLMRLLPEIVKSKNSALVDLATRSIMRDFSVESEIFTSQEFLDLDMEGLIELLKWDRLAIPEIEIYNGAYRWAENRVANRLGRMLKHGDEKSSEISKELQDVLQYIRFPLMAPDEFGACGAVKLMKNEDKRTISSYMFFLSQGDLDFLNNPDNDPLPFNKTRRSAPNGTNSNVGKASQNAKENQIVSSIPPATGKSDSEETEYCENNSPVGFTDVIVIEQSQPENIPTSAPNEDEDTEAAQNPHLQPQEDLNDDEQMEIEQSNHQSSSKELTMNPEPLDLPRLPGSSRCSSRTTSTECFADESENESFGDSDNVSMRSRKRSLPESLSSLTSTEAYDSDDDAEMPLSTQLRRSSRSRPGPASKKLRLELNPPVFSSSSEDEDGDDSHNGTSYFMDPGSSLSTIIYNVDDFEDALLPSDISTLDDFYATYQETKVLELDTITAVGLDGPLLITTADLNPIILPNLRTFSISYIYKGSTVSRAPDRKLIPLPTYLESLDIPQNLLFVRPSLQMSSEEFLKSLWKSDIEIHVKIDGITILHKHSGSLTVSGLCANVNSILSGLQDGPPLTILNLDSISIPSFDGIPTLNLKTLTLKNVKVEFEPLQTFLSQSPNLLEVSIHIAKREKSDVRFNLDLNFNAPNLRTLALGSMDQLKCSGKMEKLEELFINDCNVRSLAKNFQKRFPSLKKIQIYNSSINAYLALASAKHPKCEWIGYSGMARRWTHERANDGVDVMNAVQSEFLELSGLLEAGWEDCSENGRKTFILTRTNVEEEWEANLMDLSLEEFAKMEYMHFNWPIFYDNRDAYLNWRMQIKLPKMTRLPRKKN